MLYEGATVFFGLFAYILVDKYLKQLTAKISIAISYVITIFFFIYLYYTTNAFVTAHKLLFITILLTLNITQLALYWIPHHYYFIKSTKKSEKGKKLGILISLPILLGVLSPIVGGYIIEQYDFAKAFAITTITLIAAAITFLPAKPLQITTKHNWKNIINKKNPRVNTIYFIEGFITVGTGLIWPILLYLHFQNALTVGIFYTLTTIIYALFSYYVGKRVDTKGFTKYIIIGSIGFGLTLIIRGFAETTILILATQAMGATFSPFWVMPVNSFFFKSAQKKTSDTILNRELYLNLGRIITIIIFITLLTIATQKIAFITTLTIIGLLTIATTIIFPRK
jgi:YQGE family putative transporter